MKRLDSFGASLFLLLGWFLFLPQSMHAQVENFYAGKNIRLVVGYGAATATDLWARLIARHMPKYIPGSPTMVVQNMPGATSLIAANHMYGVAKPDGLTLGVIAPALYFDQLVGLHRESNADERDLFRQNGCSLQKHRGYPQSFSAAQVRGNRNCVNRLLFPHAHGTNSGHQVQHYYRLSGR